MFFFVCFCFLIFCPNMLLSLPVPSLLPFPIQFRLPHQLPVFIISNLHSPSLYSRDWISENQHTWSDPVSRYSVQTQEKNINECQVLMCLYFASAELLSTMQHLAEQTTFSCGVWLLPQLKRLCLTENASVKKAVMKTSKASQKFLYPWKMFLLANAV